jgi:acetyl-CoA acetyltransferase family protein
MPEAVIVAACRTAIGTSRKGSLTETTANELAHAVIEESVQRAGLPKDVYDDVIFGESNYGGGDIARHAAITTGMVSVPGVALNRHCASGLTAVQMAAASIKAGMDRAVVAGGVQSSSTAPVSRKRRPGTSEWEDNWISPTHPDSPQAPNLDMSITVGWNTAEIAGVSRQEMDAWALRSHQRAVAAIDGGRFAEEIIPLKVVTSDGTSMVFDTDEHPRRDSSMERLSSLKPLHPEIPDFSITAGNSSGINDGAASLVLTSDEIAAEHGVTALATVLSWASVGVDPMRTGLAPVEAIPKALERAGLSVGDVDLFEINEAFASVCVATSNMLSIDQDIINVSGSGCSLGHPVACSGARMITTLIFELRRRGGGVGVAAMCAGGGMGSALVFKVPGR